MRAAKAARPPPIIMGAPPPLGGRYAGAPVLTGAGCSAAGGFGKSLAFAISSHFLYTSPFLGNDSEVSGSTY